MHEGVLSQAALENRRLTPKLRKRAISGRKLTKHLIVKSLGFSWSPGGRSPDCGLWSTQLSYKNLSLASYLR
jgi:hypothetical protein